jgi:hypothetical protein
MEQFECYVARLKESASERYDKLLQDPIKTLHVHWCKATGETVAPSGNVSTALLLYI